MCSSFLNGGWGKINSSIQFQSHILSGRANFRDFLP
jgi:hypothetical protein